MKRTLQAALLCAAEMLPSDPDHFLPFSQYKETLLQRVSLYFEQKIIQKTSKKPHF